MTILEVRLIPHAEQRYPTWADWEFNDGKLTISVSEVGNWRYHLLAAIHELLEAVLCKHQNVTQSAVDAFDIPYENRRMTGHIHAACGCEITDDPGADIHAPYRAAHLYATGVEYGLAKLLGVDPNLYDAAFIALDGGAAGNRK